MKIGEKKSWQSMSMIASSMEIQSGRAVINHPRCGKVVLTRDPGEDIYHADWTITACEKPDRE